jgi:hypothetical protein
MDKSNITLFFIFFCAMACTTSKMADGLPEQKVNEKNLGKLSKNGMGLTDNKTLIAFVFWIIAILANIKNERCYLIVLAAIIMLLVFLHSTQFKRFGTQTRNGEDPDWYVNRARQIKI